jgi:hypothetical protein
VTRTRRLLKYGLWTVIAAIVLGATGFLCGYFGPLMLNPDANDAPLFGIFITGPLGALLGATIGIVAAASSLSRQSFAAILAALALMTAGLILYLSLPEDRLDGFVIDAETVACEGPTSLVDEATARWEKWNSETQWRTPRPRWREEISGMIARDRGVVLRMVARRRWEIYKQRKPWNRGRLVLYPSRKQVSERYFVRGSCDAYRTGTRDLYAPQWEASSVTPPDILPTFLGLDVLEPVPERYRVLLNP